MQIYAGEDTYASYNAARQAARKLAARENLELLVLEASDTTPGQLAGYISGMSLFDSGKCVLLKRPAENSDVHSYLTDLGDSAGKLILWLDTKPDARTKLIKDAKKSGSLYDFPRLNENKLSLWITQRAKELELKWSHELTSLLLEFTAGDRWRIENELTKLQTFAQATDGEISPEILRQLIGAEVGGDIWKLLDGIGGPDKKVAVRELEKLLRYEDSSQYVIPMLAREIGLLARVKSSPDGSGLKLHPFVLD